MEYNWICDVIRGVDGKYYMAKEGKLMEVKISNKEDFTTVESKSSEDNLPTIEF